MSQTTSAAVLSTIGKADYGIDAPGVIRNFFLIGVAGAVAGWFLPSFSIAGYTITFVGSTLFWWSLVNIASSVFMILYARHGKFKHRDRMLDMISWKGGETVLDIGTGRGLLMIGAAKRLTTGRSIGIDIWNAEDLSGNKMENTLRNIRVEGVEGKVDLRSEDVRKMTFPDSSFDVILSNLCVHNIYNPEERAQACREIARVLKSGGTALISDFRHTAEYEAELARAGLRVRRTKPFLLDTYPPLRIVIATKEKH